MGTNSVSIASNSYEVDLDTKNGIGSSVKIGRVINQQYAIYYHRQVSWVKTENNGGEFSST